MGIVRKRQTINEGEKDTLNFDFTARLGDKVITGVPVATSEVVEGDAALTLGTPAVEAGGKKVSVDVVAPANCKFTIWEITVVVGDSDNTWAFNETTKVVAS